MARAQPDELTEDFQLKKATDGYHNLNLLGFLQCLKKIVSEMQLSVRPSIIIALDNVDKLFERNLQDLLRSFCRLGNEVH
jgi:Cdc6-like AAA superfamily ATPase